MYRESINEAFHYFKRAKEEWLKYCKNNTSELLEDAFELLDTSSEAILRAIDESENIKHNTVVMIELSSFIASQNYIGFCIYNEWQQFKSSNWFFDKAKEQIEYALKLATEINNCQLMKNTKNIQLAILKDEGIRISNDKLLNM